MNEARNIIDILVEHGKLTQEQASQVRTQAVTTGVSLETLVSEGDLVSPTDVLSALSLLNNIPVVKLSEVGTSPEAMAMVDEGLATRYGLFPFALDDNTGRLSVAMKNPLDLTAVTFLSQKTGKRLDTFYALADEIDKAISTHYKSDLTDDVSSALAENEEEGVVSGKSVQDFSALNSDGIMRQAPIAKIVEQILGFAVGSDASDIHIEPQENRLRIRYRIDGILQEKLILPRSVASALVSRVKILSRLKIDEKRLPQDGRFNFVSDKGEVDLRVSTLPTVHGEKVVMRLLRKQNRIATLEDLGMRGKGLNDFNEAVKIPQGIILVTGPTGSGKTTTLYSAINIINTTAVNIMTLEDPVEYEMTGVSQVQVNVQAGLTFASGLRSFLRQDPDVIMVGEIRDGETAGLAVQASLTGHKVFSTLHTNSAAGAIPRMIDMGIETFLLASSVTLMMAQRVARRLQLDHCEEYQPSEVVLQDIRETLGVHFDTWLQANGKTPDQVRLWRPKTDLPPEVDGYKGRIAIFEVMPVTPVLQELITKNSTAQELEAQGIKDGMLLMKQDGYLKALDGITTIEEVLRVAEI